MPLLFVHPANFIPSLSPALTEPVGAFCYPQRERKESPMSKVNFVSEFIAIMRYARDYSLTLRERMLWIALFYAANDRAEPI